MIPLGQNQNPLGIMKTVKLGPQMDQATFDLIINFNNGWVSRNEPSYEEQLKTVAAYNAFQGCVFVQVKPLVTLQRLADVEDGKNEFVYFAADIYPVCRTPAVRETLLHVLDRLVSQKDASYSIFSVHYL